jgi:DNA-binding IclR family transcriptional regulator
MAKETTIKLADRLQYSIDFDVELNGRIMTLFHEADESTEIGFKEGDYFRLHTSSTGKAILAELPESEMLGIIETQDMTAKTEYTHTDPKDLIADIETTRERGYAVIDQEWLEGLRAVGVAVNLPNGRPLGAISAGGPMYRLSDEVIKSEVAPTLIEAAEELEEDISGVLN